MKREEELGLQGEKRRMRTRVYRVKRKEEELGLQGETRKKEN